MTQRLLDKETLLSESAYSRYTLRVSRRLPKGVLTLVEAKCSDDIKILYSRHYNVAFFTDDYTFALHTLSDFSRLSVKLPFVYKDAAIYSHEAFLETYCTAIRLIETIDELIDIINLASSYINEPNM